jgi:nucleoside-diphosphate-sugar epimerase
MAAKRVVVTGGSGRIGAYVIRELMASWDVVNADIIPGTEDVQFLETDVMDLNAVRKATKGVDAIIHLAGLDLHRNADPDQFVHVNTQGSWHVLQAAQENGVKKVVLSSSVAACGLSEMRPEWTPLYLPVDEEHECRPVHSYSVSKMLIEQMALSFVQGTDMSVICLRPLAVVMKENLDRYIASIDDPDRHWLFYYVTAEDVARAFRAAIDVKDLKYGVFYLSSNDTSRREPTLEWYEERIGTLPKIPNTEFYVTNPRASIFSSAKARDLLGWEPTSNFNDLRTKANRNTK